MKSGLLPAALASPPCDAFVTWMADNKMKRISCCTVAFLYLGECRVGILVWPLLFVLFVVEFLSGFFLLLLLYLPVSSCFPFPFFQQVVTAAVSFLPEQFFKLFTRQLAALTFLFWQFKWRRHLVYTSVLFCLFRLPLSPQITLLSNRPHLITIWKWKLWGKKG